MLTALSIRQVVIIEALDLSFSPGLNTLTGETGAGKSILLDALGLALGARADTDLIAVDSDQAIVTASFQLPNNHPVWSLLAEAGAQPDDIEYLVLRRILNSDGRSRAFINDTLVSIGLLRQVGELIAEVHGQFEQQGLLHPNQHQKFLDAIGNLEGDAKEVASLWSSLREVESLLSEATTHASSVRDDEVYLRQSISELLDLSPTENEETDLANRRAFLVKRSRLSQALANAIQALENSNAASILRQSERSLSRLAEEAEGRFDSALAALERAGIELSEAEQALFAASDSLDADPETLDSLDSRLIAIRRLARKHNVRGDELPKLLEKLQNELERLERADEHLSDLSKKVVASRSNYFSAAEKLSKKRIIAARQLEIAVHKELPPLKLERAEIQVENERLEEDHWGPNGIDRIRFLARANIGVPFSAMHKVASGGELARFALALRVVLATNETVGMLIFDEVDAGVGGATATAVGERLKRLATGVQTLVITHSPQVAALGEHQYQVEKSEVNGKTRTSVIKLEGKARREEIARMLSGSSITQEARAQADRLLENS
jgi:DNA repair protein RecN (Recombination protein N)